METDQRLSRRSFLKMGAFSAAQVAAAFAVVTGGLLGHAVTPENAPEVAAWQKLYMQIEEMKKRTEQAKIDFTLPEKDLLGIAELYPHGYTVLGGYGLYSPDGIPGHPEFASALIANQLIFALGKKDLPNFKDTPRNLSQTRLYYLKGNSPRQASAGFPPPDHVSLFVSPAGVFNGIDIGEMPTWRIDGEALVQAALACEDTSGEGYPMTFASYVIQRYLEQGSFPETVRSSLSERYPPATSWPIIQMG